MKKLILILAILLGSFASAQEFDFKCITSEELREIRKADILSLNSAQLSFTTVGNSDAVWVSKSTNTWRKIPTKDYESNTFEGLTDLKYIEFKNRIISQLEFYELQINN